MVLKEKQMARSHDLVPIDANHELIRLARARNTEIDKELRILLEEDDNINMDYKVALFCHILDPREKKNDNDDGTRHQKRLKVSKKRKDIIDVDKHDDDCSHGEEDDPQYVLFLKHLKVHGRAYVLENKHGCLKNANKYEEGTDSDKESDPDFEPRKPSKAPKKKDRRMLTLKNKCRTSYQMCGMENQSKYDSQSISVKKTNNADEVENMGRYSNDMMVDLKHLSLHQIVEFGGNHDVSMLRSHTEVDENINDQKQENEKKLQRSMKSKNEISHQIPGMENQWRTSIKKTKSLTCGKSRNKIDNEENHLYRNNKFEDDPHSRLENQCKLDLQLVSANKTKSLPLMISTEDAHNEWIECSTSEFTEVKAAKCLTYKNTEIDENINDQKQENGKKLQRAVKSESEISHQMSRMENQWRTSIKKIKSLTCGKLRNEIDNEENHLHRDNKFEDDRHSFFENPCKLDLQLSLANETKCLPLMILTDEAQNDWIECSTSEFTEVKTTKCLPYKNVEEKNLEKESEGNSISDVEILDETAYFEKGILSPFVSSRTYSESMGVDGVQQVGRSSARDEFRKRALQLLKKPYDKEEYMRHLKAVRDERYLEYHPDLEGKLKKYRYNRRKRLTILRGFFFWIQNLTQEGSFKPWMDRTCLAVEPRSP